MQQTLRRPVELQGVGLHSGKHVHLRLLPSPPHQGIEFVRTDLKGCPRVPANIQYIREIQRRTALVRDSAEVHTVEHLLAACYALSLTNLEIELDGEEIPGFDGSALEIYRAIEKAGIETQGFSQTPLVLKERIEIGDSQSPIQLTASPFPGGLHLTYILKYPHPLLSYQEQSILLTPENFAREIAPARTFVLAQEVEALRRAGLGKGATPSNTLVYSDQGVLENTLRFENEGARHKLLDLIGDLALLGHPLCAQITAIRSGHATNQQLVQKLQALLEAQLSLPSS
jgi:UDP-3-O-acyl N-acetylglucosamine deacetylase